jgi:cardiolipin synthase
MPTRTLTPANQITILRLIFVPVFAILVVGGHYVWALAVLAAAAVSDIVDGTVARRFQQETPLGVALDPIADKLLMTTAYLILAFRGVLPWWLTILVLSRDAAIIITALLISLVAGYRPFRPSIPGKVSTVMQVATIFVAVAFAAHVPLVTSQLLEVFVYLAGALTLVSGIHYLAVAHRYAHHVPSETARELRRLDSVGAPGPEDGTATPSETASRRPS